MRVLACALVVLIGTAVEGREWNDRTGKHAREANFVSLEAGVVKLQSNEGRQLEIDWDDLSQADQEYVTLETSETSQVAQQASGSAVFRDVEELPEDRSSSSDAAESSHPHLLKVAFHTAHGDFHLMLTRYSRPNGTALYSRHGCRYMTALQFDYQTADFIYCRTSFGDPEVVEWAFSRKPVDCHHHHSVWYRTIEKGWCPYGLAWIEFPK